MIKFMTFIDRFKTSKTWGFSISILEDDGNLLKISSTVCLILFSSFSINFNCGNLGYLYLFEIYRNYFTWILTFNNKTSFKEVNKLAKKLEKSGEFTISILSLSSITAFD